LEQLEKLSWKKEGKNPVQTKLNFMHTPMKVINDGEVVIVVYTEKP
jgi:hypothetical protein